MSRRDNSSILNTVNNCSSFCSLEDNSATKRYLMELFNTYINPPPKNNALPRHSRSPQKGSRRRSQNERQEVSYANVTKLFRCIEEKSWSLVLSRLKKNPLEAQTWIVLKGADGGLTWRRLPIHEACMRSPPSEVIDALLLAYPSSASIADNTRRLAIHHACANETAAEIFNVLLIAYPDSIENEDMWFNTPRAILEKSSPNPDPIVISMFERGTDYYKKKAIEKTIIESESKLQVHGSFERRNSSERRGRRSSSVRPSSSGQRDSLDPESGNHKKIIASLEEELGKFSERLASSLDKENSFIKKIDDLQKEVDRNNGSESLTEEVERLTLKIEQLEDGNSDINISREELKQETLEKSLVIEELEKRIDDLEIDGGGQNNQTVKQLEKRIEDLENNLTEAVDAMDEAETSFIEDQKMNNEEFIELEQKLRIAQNEIEGLTARTETAENEKQAMVIELQSINKSFSEDIESSNITRVKLNDMVAQKKQIESELEMLDNHMFAKDEELRKVTEEAQMRNQELDNHMFAKDEELRNLREKVQIMEGQGNQEMQNQLFAKDHELKNSSLRLEELSMSFHALNEGKGAELQDKEGEIMKYSHMVQEKDEELMKSSFKMQEKDEELKKIALKLQEKEEDTMRHSLKEQELYIALQESNKKNEERNKESEMIAQQKRELNERLKAAEKANTDIINMTFKEKNDLKQKNNDFQQIVSDLDSDKRRMSDMVARLSHDLEMAESTLTRSNDNMQTKAYEANSALDHAESELARWSERANSLETRNNQLAEGQDELIRKNAELTGVASDHRRLEQELFDQRAHFEAEKRESESRRGDLESTIASLAAKVDKAESKCAGLQEETLVAGVIKRDLNLERNERTNINHLLRQSEEEKRKLEVKVRFLMEDVHKMRSGEHSATEYRVDKNESRYHDDNSRHASERPPVYKGAPQQNYEDDDNISQVSGVSYGTYLSKSVNRSQCTGRDEKRGRDWNPIQPAIKEESRKEQLGYSSPQSPMPARPSYSLSSGEQPSSFRNASPLTSGRRSPSPTRTESGTGAHRPVGIEERRGNDYIPHSNYTHTPPVQISSSTRDASPAHTHTELRQTRHDRNNQHGQADGSVSHRSAYQDVSSSRSVSTQENYRSNHNMKPPEYIRNSDYRPSEISARVPRDDSPSSRSVMSQFSSFPPPAPPSQMSQRRSWSRSPTREREFTNAVPKVPAYNPNVYT